MSANALLSLIIYTLVASITPGPNNFMILASGVNFGFARSTPHMLGITIGFLVMLLAIGFGLGAMLVAFPVLDLVLKIVGGAYLLYLAWKIAASRAMNSADYNTAKPMTFLQAAAFQWVNPKAWVIGVSAMALYTIPERPFLSVWLISLVFAAVCLPSIAIWAGFGVSLRGFLSDPARLKWFNIAMGLLLVASLWPMLRH